MTFREGRTGSTACKPEMNIFLNPCPWERPTDDTLPHNFDKNKESLEKMVDAYQKSKHLYLHHSKLVFVWDLKIHYFKLIRYPYRNSAGLCTESSAETWIKTHLPIKIQGISPMLIHVFRIFHHRLIVLSFLQIHLSFYGLRSEL